MNREKMIRLSGKLDVLFRVLQRIITIAMLVTLIVMAVLTVVNWINPHAVIGEGFASLDFGTITLQVTPQHALTNGQVLTYAWSAVLLAAAAAALWCHAFGCIRRVLAPMKQGDPFRPEAADHIRRLAFVSLGLGVVQNIGTMLPAVLMLRICDLHRLANGDPIRSITVNFNPDLTCLIGFFLLLLISCLFRYGTELQQLSDETL